MKFRKAILSAESGLVLKFPLLDIFSLVVKLL